MKKKSLFLRLTSLILTLSILICFVGCADDKAKDIPVQKKEEKTELDAEDLMSAIVSKDRPAADDLKEKSKIFTDFAVELFKHSEKEGENTLISPLSVLAALSMTANGAKGETLAQMENVLGMSRDELNEYVYSYMNILTSTEDYKLELANSIWFRDAERFTVNEDFLQTNADWYKADVYKDFFDEETKDNINLWVRENTDGMIDEIIDEIPAEALMYLINALAFEAKWDEKYEEYQVREDIFTAEDGKTQNVEFMYSDESIYLEDDDAVGFAKYYKDGKYAFAALLPDEGISLSDYVASLTGEKLNNILTYSQNTTVSAAIPKFESEYGTEMSEVLSDMGMPIAFTTSADFSDLGSSSAGPIYIGRVLHKTFISVDENGTKAAAVTAVEMVEECCPVIEDPKQVYLDRPFVYMLIDCETNIPFFIGTVMNI